jgi:hypothetical protein
MESNKNFETVYAHAIAIRLFSLAKSVSDDDFHIFQHLKLVKAVKSKLRWLMSALD